MRARRFQVDVTGKRHPGLLGICVLVGSVMFLASTLVAGSTLFRLKDEAPETVVQAIRSVMLGAIWFSRAVLARLAQSQPSHGISILNEREREILNLVALGWSNRRIAVRLDLADQTVRNYLSQVYQKLGLGSKSEAIVWAREHDLDLDTNDKLA